MRKVVLSLLCLAVLCHSYAQNKRFNVVFKPEQTAIADDQKKAINDITADLNTGDKVMFYPLAYDSIMNLYRYTVNSKQQGAALAEYAAGIGFELIGIPSNFPSGYSGHSVGVSMKYTKTLVPVATTDEDKKPETGEIKDHFPVKPSQYFVIDPKRDTMIIGNEGTKLLFKAGCLLSKEKVQIELKEYYALDDYIKAGLPTVSNGKMIQTGGSMYLNATETNAGKKQVKIAPDKGVGVDFTLGKKDPDMQIFIKDPRPGNGMNWILPPKRTVTESWQMTETVIGPDGKVVSEQKYNSKAEWEQHVKEEAQKEKERKEAEALREKEEALKEKERKKAEAFQMAIQNKMDSKLQVYQLGYINCDKFPNEPLMQLTMAADEKIKAEYYLVYTDIRGVLKGNVYDRSVNFSSIAKDRQAVLIGVSFIDKQAYYFKCTIAPGGKPSAKVVLQPVEESFLNQQLALLK